MMVLRWVEVSLSEGQIIPRLASRASAIMTLSISAKSLTGAGVNSTPKEVDAVSIERRNNGKYGAVFGVKRTATCRMEGTISLSNSIHLPPIENSNAVNPVMWPPGWSRLLTKPWPTGSDAETNTIGIVLVAFWKAANASVALARMTSGASATSSATEMGMLRGSVVAQR